MWNDTDTPLAYLITFRTYGTWLHGDARGSIDRHNNTYGAPKYSAEPHWNRISADRLQREPVTLNAFRRTCVDKAIRETCEKRDWRLIALNVRTNHVHVVAAIGNKPPNAALNAFKANATRHMRLENCWNSELTPWADKGSERYLWNEKHIADATEYVINGQGDNLPVFE
jgi:REP element-mobilizing transposase RayT